jgi:hypothetical protein
MREEKGKWEEMIRSKLYDFESDVSPDDWAVISRKLSEGKSVRLYPYRRYVSVAAAVVVLLIAGGVYFYSYRDPGQDIVAVTEQQPDLSPVVDESVQHTVEPAVDNRFPRFSGRHPGKMRREERDASAITEPPVRLKTSKVVEADIISMKKTNADVEKLKVPVQGNVKPEVPPDEKPFVADASKGVKRRRWGFGVGGGSYSVNSSSGSTAPVMLSSIQVRDESMLKEVMDLNDNPHEPIGYNPNPGVIRAYTYEAPTGKVEHKTPISAGLGVSYFLNGRWALQSGITYTFLRSEWNSDNTGNNYAEYKQNLHYLGVPLSVSYKIAEWNRFLFYASAGGMCEYNVAGRYKITSFSENLEETSNNSLCMKKPVWSVNTRAGVSYPLWKFINAYAEAGASYYFDNNSKIVTIRSDKPFNVSLQAGIRFGF